MAMIFVSCLAYALLLSIIFSYMPNIRTLKDGFVMGALVGILIATMTNSYWYATSHFFNNFKPVLADIIAAGITVGIMGGVIAWVLGRG